MGELTLPDTLPEFLITWIAYCMMGWILLDLVRCFEVASFASVFLCGPVFGRVGEGVVVGTLFGNATNPFPLSIERVRIEIQLLS